MICLYAYTFDCLLFVCLFSHLLVLYLCLIVFFFFYLHFVCVFHASFAFIIYSFCLLAYLRLAMYFSTSCQIESRNMYSRRSSSTSSQLCKQNTMGSGAYNVFQFTHQARFRLKAYVRFCSYH